MRVLFILAPECACAESLSVAHHALGLSAGLNKRDIESLVFMTEDVTRQVLLPESARIITWDTGAEQELRGVIRRLRPDVVQIENRPDMVRSVRSCYNGQVVLSLHSLEYLAGHRITRRELRVALCMVDKVVTQSHYLRKLFLGRYYGLRGKTHVVHPGVDISLFNPSPEQRALLRSSLGLRDEKVVLMVGRNTVEQSLKEFQVVLPIWPDVHKATGARLLVAGTPLPTRVEEMIFPQQFALCSLSCMNRPELARAYQVADVLAYPLQERNSTGTIVLDALAAGIPVVASLQGGVDEFVDSACGILVRQYADSSTWARILKDLLSNDTRMQELREGAAIKGHSFTWEQAVLRTLAVYSME